MKTHSLIAPTRSDKTHTQQLNPLTNLTPSQLMAYIDQFRAGHLKNAALAWELIEKRDDVVRPVAAKRKKAASRHGWEILVTTESPEALAQKAVLEKFYNNITASAVLEPNDQGGMSMLIRQMMDAVCKKYAVHEIIWKPNANGDLTAEFRFCPLWWFETVSGPLRFLPNDTAQFGNTLQKDGWLVTISDGVMESASIAWLVKWWALKDWSLHSARYGTPWIKGVSTSDYHSPEWEQLSGAVKQFVNNMAAVFAGGETVEIIETKGTGNTPYEALIDRMDRAIARIFLGSDLATLSRANAVGASLQENSDDILAVEDCEMLGETLAKQVSKFVLEHAFGEGVERQAYIRIRAKTEKDIKHDIEIDTFLASIGMPMPVKATLERYGRPMPSATEAVINQPSRSRGNETQTQPIPHSNS